MYRANMFIISDMMIMNSRVLEQYVRVNYWGTLISDTEIDLSDGSPYDHYSILSQSEIDELDETMNEIIFS